MWGLGIAAGALHHWPVTSPRVLGEPLRYTGSGGDAAAELKRRGVDYVLGDRFDAPPRCNRIPGRVVFRNDALLVYRL